MSSAIKFFFGVWRHSSEKNNQIQNLTVREKRVSSVKVTITWHSKGLPFFWETVGVFMVYLMTQ